jgi:hypothetical protein
MNDLDARLQRLATEATKDAMAPDVEVIMRRARHRRALSQPVLTGTVALVLVLAAVVALAAVRGQDRAPAGPPATTVSTSGWKTYTDTVGNFRFRYPPDWRLEEVGRAPLEPEFVRLVPPEFVDRPKQPGFVVSVQALRLFWSGEDWSGSTTMGRLPGGQAYLRTANDPTETRGWEQPPPPNVADRPRDVNWSIDWGRPCLTADARCVPHSVRFAIRADDGRLWDRYRAVAETIPITVEQLRTTAPSVGDRGLPACRPQQWRLIWPEEYGAGRGDQRLVIEGGVQHRQGPRCHLRLTLRMAVEDDGGRLLPVRGNPASTTVEGDLPVDGMRTFDGSWVIGGALSWHFVWDEWCNRGLPQARLRVTADGGASLTVPGLDPTPDKRPRPAAGLEPCQDRGRPSVVAGWP